MLALEGECGGGKSTIMALIQPFYDIVKGSMKLDLREFQVLNLRENMGVVWYETDLFKRFILDNVAYGLIQSDGTVVSNELITAASKQANAHDLIIDLAVGYDYVVARAETICQSGRGSAWRLCAQWGAR